MKVSEEYYPEPLDRSKPPISAQPICATFPDWFETVLPNGLKVMVYEQPAAPLVSIRLYVKAGSIDEGARHKAAMVAFAMLLQGTTSRTADEIAEEVDFIGAELGAWAGLDHSLVSLSVMPKYLKQGLALMSDVVLHPAFAEKELEFVRQQSLNRLRFSKSDAGRLASDAFAQQVYFPHPYSYPVLGTVQSLTALTEADVREFYSTFAVPNNSVLIATGNLKSEDFVAQLTEAFGTWQAKPLATTKRAQPNLRNAPKVILVQKDGAVQSVLMIGHLSIERAHPDYLKCYVLNTILGGYFGSRLNLSVREKQGYAYSIRSTFDAKREAGDFNISTQVRKDVTRLATTEILSQVHTLLEQGVREEELQAVKNYLSGNFVIQNESPETILSRLATVELYGLDRQYYKTFQANIQALTLDDVHKTAKMYIQPERFVFVIVGEVKAMQKEVADLGEVVQIDPNNEEQTFSEALRVSS
ncbi:MAG: pitrilysin family protein [Chloroherpetonaceae bacterium]|nr:pitrilysin family protein [Chloroherpetonaceae bacterium]